MPNKSILVAGIPRSGSTWFGQVLASSGELSYLHEPDNERHTFSAYYYKQNLPRFPFIKTDESLNAYHRLFYQAFYKPYSGLGSFSNKVLFKLARFDKELVETHLKDRGINKPNIFNPVMWLYPFLPKEIKDRRRIVKSVHCILSLEYLLKHLDMIPVIIIRHPAAVISSYLKMENPDIDRKIYNNKTLMSEMFGEHIPDMTGLKSIEAYAGFQVAIFYRMISKTIQNNTKIILVEHEKICVEPHNKFKALFDRLNLSFNEKVIDFIEQHNVKGSGYQTNRIASETLDNWKSKLDETQINEIIKGYNIIASSYYKEFC